MQEYQKTKEEVRLNKYLSESGVCSRREADRLIEEGRVMVDGEAAVMGMKISSGQEVMVDGKVITPEEKMIVLAVNKPRGIVCTEESVNRTISSVISIIPRGLPTPGRLDKDSEGLLLMTNQGDLANEIMHAGNFHEKEYIVTVDQPFNSAFIKKMQEGVELKELEVTTRPCKVKALGKKTFQITLTQGLNRQIRRMCEALGYHVVTLKRVRIMNIHLGRLNTGDYGE